jgi:hypothetical protein
VKSVEAATANCAVDDLDPAELNSINVVRIPIHHCPRESAPLDVTVLP